MIGLRCRGDDAGHAHCRNPRCACPGHANEPQRTQQLREAKSRGRKRGVRHGVYYMSDPEQGDTYDFRTK